MKRLILSLVVFFFLACGSASAAPAVQSLLVDHGVSLNLSAPAASVFVANPDIADVQVLSPTQVMLFGKRTGKTTFMATDPKGVVLAERTLVVTQDLSGLRQEINAAIPGNRIKATPVPGGIILTGTARDPASVADAYKIALRYMPENGDIINRIQVTGSNQIQIRVRFAEVQRNINNSFGFNWQALLSAGSNLTVGLATASTVKTGTGVFDSSATGTGLFPRPNNTSLSMDNNVFGVSSKIGNLTLDGMVDALAQEGYLTILAEPNLTAMSGETANFLAGGEFPIPIPQGNGTMSIQFQSYGISLAFTPTLLSGNRVSLHVRPEVSELTEVGSIVTDNISVPALTTRKAETTVEVGSGESFAIAGLLNNNQTQTINKFPMLGDLPILGSLFRSDHFINGQTELVVIITPYIVRPSMKELSLPTDGLAPPSESERLVHMRYSSGRPDARPITGDPTGVFDENPNAPVAAPIAPVLKSASPEKETVLAPGAISVPVTETPKPVAKSRSAIPVSAPDSASIESAVPVSSTPAASVPASSAPPLVLHTPRDADKRTGGLLVE